MVAEPTVGGCPTCTVPSDTGTSAVTARDWTILRLSLLFVGLVATLGCPGFGSNEPESVFTDDTAPLCEQAMVVLDARCNSCHSAPPQQGAPGYFRSDVFGTEGGVQGAVAQADRILARSEDGTMPPSNTLTGDLTDAELQILRDWHAAGAPSAPCDGTTAADAGIDTGAADTGTTDTGATDAGAADTATPDTGATDTGTTDTLEPCDDCVTLSQVVDEVFAPSCATGGCHDMRSLGGGIALEGDDLMDVLLASSFQLPAMPRVTPGDEDRSYLYLKVVDEHADAGGFGTIMPPGGGMSDQAVDLLRDWIRDGARP